MAVFQWQRILRRYHISLRGKTVRATKPVVELFSRKCTKWMEPSITVFRDLNASTASTLNITLRATRREMDDALEGKS